MPEAGFTAVTRQSVGDQVVEQLRIAIYGGIYRPGDSLPTERELCERFDVSRATVREALRALEAQGLIVSAGRPLSRTVTPQGASAPLRQALDSLLALRQVSIEDLMELRLALEASAVRRAARVGDQEALDRADVALAGMRAHDSDLEVFEQYEAAFHLALVEASGNEAIRLTMTAARDSMRAFILAALDAKPVQPTDRLVAEHEAILAAVRDGDADRAERLMIAHIGYGLPSER
jgi:GntR family transcriptional regulator, transcriptional repressor for pyruvate dehydrogenase complex